MSRTAPVEEIHRAYQDLARRMHPDRYAGAPPDVISEATRTMAQLNQAWSVLGHALRRAEYDRRLGAGAPPAEPVRERAADECVLCGSAPAAAVTFRSQTGLLVRSRVTRSSGPFCRLCGLSVFRRLTNRTLVAGWWGILSFFTNWWTLARNLLAAEAVRALDEPRRSTDRIAVPLGRPLDPRPSLFRRSGVYFVALVVAVAVAVVALPAADSTPRPTDLSEYQGRCLELTRDGQRIVRTVACTASHDARVVAIVRPDEQCPSPADAYFVHDASGQRLCVTSGSG